MFHTPSSLYWPAAGVRFRIEDVNVRDDEDLADELLIGFEDGATSFISVEGLCHGVYMHKLASSLELGRLKLK